MQNSLYDMPRVVQKSQLVKVDVLNTVNAVREDVSEPQRLQVRRGTKHIEKLLGRWNVGFPVTAELQDSEVEKEWGFPRQISALESEMGEKRCSMREKVFREN